jgi:hypothetical protein
MRVGICYTKKEGCALSHTNAIKEGIKACGDQAVSIKSIHDLSKLRNCDVSFQVCEECFDLQFPDNIFRAGIKSMQETLNKPRIILDAGFIKHAKDYPLETQYIAISIGAVKREGLSHTKNSPPDRWNQLGIIKPQWRTDGDHILVLGQVAHGIGTKSMRSQGVSFTEWVSLTLNNIRAHTDRKIIYKPHPMNNQAAPLVTNSEVAKSDRLGDYLSNCWCAVASASNGAVDCIMGGIPVVTDDKMSMVHEISSHSLEEIESPKTPDLTQWLHDISYAQWSIEELMSGKTWEYIKHKL